MELIQNIPLSVKFLIERKRGKNETDYLIYARILLKRDKALISLKMSVKKEDWDFENGQFRNLKSARNAKLAEAKNKITQVYQNLIRAGVPISAASIKKSLKAHDGNITESSEMEFMVYYNQHLEELKRIPAEYGEGVIGHYHKTKVHLERFLKLHGWQHMRLNELSRKFLERFENYLLTTPNLQRGVPINNNTCTTYIRKLRACINAAVRQDVLQTNPFVGFKLRPFKHANRVSLTIEEIKLVQQHDLGGNLALQKVRDCFVFCCSTGLRHSDAVQLHQKMIRIDSEGIYWISLFQRKTKDYIEIPMTDAALEIYNKYESHRNATGFALPMLTNQRVNAHLKIIADLTGINKRLSFHASRHSFATNALELGVDIASISSMLGHRTIKTTQIYAKMTRRRKIDVIRFLNERAKPQ